MFPWGNTAMGGYLLENLCSSGELDKCQSSTCNIHHTQPSNNVNSFPPRFSQADLDVDVFMELPFGFEYENMNRAYVPKLNRSSYGINQSLLNWFATLKKGFEDREYEQSDIDPCVFYRKDSIILCYVDDCLIIANQ